MNIKNLSNAVEAYEARTKTPTSDTVHRY